MTAEKLKAQGNRLTRHVVQLIGPPTAILELLGKGRQEVSE